MSFDNYVIMSCIILIIMQFFNSISNYKPNINATSYQQLKNGYNLILDVQPKINFLQCNPNQKCVKQFN